MSGIKSMAVNSNDNILATGAKVNIFKLRMDQEDFGTQKIINLLKV
jgi:hypothetical protein